MKLPMPAAMLAASLLLALPALAANAPDAAAVAPRKVDPAALELILLAPLPQAKSTGGSPFKPRLRAPERVTKTLETRVRFERDGQPVVDCVEADGHAHPHANEHTAAEARL